MTAEELAERLAAKTSGPGVWSARCPAHDDSNPSLSIAIGEQGGVVLYCHKGCSTVDILAKLGLTMLDLAPPKANGEVFTSYRYTDETGTLLYEVVRKPGKKFLQRRPDGFGEWIWKMGDTRRVLYRLPQVIKAVTGGTTVFICEGEKDVDRLVAEGYCATTNPGGAGKWDKVAALAQDVLRGADVIVVRDRDPGDGEPGRSHANEVAASLRGIASSVLLVEPVEGKDAYDHLAAGHTVDDLLEVAEDPPSTTTETKLEKPSMRSRLLSVADLAHLPQLEPVVGQLLDFDTIVLAYGRRDSAKSFVAIDLLTSVASGSRWHGRTVTLAPAIYVVAEGAAGLDPRFVAWQTIDRNVGTPLPAERLMILPEPVNLLNPAAVGEFADVAAEVGARFIVFDTLARCMVGGDENSAKDAGLAIEQLDVIRRRTSACIIVVHHSGKNLDNGARGSSAFEAACDTVLEIGMTDNIVVITCTKQKNHVAPNPIRLRLRSTGRSAVLDDYRADGSEMPHSVLETLTALRDIEITGGVSASAWRLSSGKTEPTFYRHRKDLLTIGLVHNIGTEKQARYQVSDTGTIALSLDSQDSE